MRGIHLAVVAIVILPVLFPSSRVRAQTCSTRSIELDEGNSIPEAGRILIDQRTTGASPPPSDVGEGSFTIELWLKSAPGGQLVPTTGYRSPGQSESDDFDWVAGNIFLDRSVWDPRYPAYGASIHRDEILGVVRFGVRSGTIAGAGVDARYTLQGSRDVLDGAWHHVALVRDASNGRLAIFVDGALDATSSSDFRATTVDVSYPNGAELVGEPSAAANNPERSPFLLLGTEKHDLGVDSPGFRGWLDELRIWDVARGAADIAADYARVVPVGEGGPVASYRFEEGSGLTIFDAGPGPPATLSTGTPSGSDGGWSNDAAPLVSCDPPPSPECSDGLDNDGDGFIDHPADPDCLDAADPIEAGLPLAPSCPGQPEPTGICQQADKSILLIRDRHVGGISGASDGDKLAWRWLKGVEAASQEEFADPTDDTDYTLCIYEGNPSSLTLDLGIPSAARGGPWRSLDGRGYRYRGSEATEDGVVSALVIGGSPGRPKVLVVGKGQQLPIPMNLLPLDTGGDVIVQLRNERLGTCWESAFPLASWRTNRLREGSVGLFRAVTP